MKAVAAFGKKYGEGKSGESFLNVYKKNEQVKFSSLSIPEQLCLRQKLTRHGFDKAIQHIDNEVIEKLGI